MTATRWALGIMSGTSLDGVDVALVEASGSGYELEVRLVAFCCDSYTEPERVRIHDTIERGGASEIARLDRWLGERFARSALRLLHAEGVDPGRVDCVGTHGQTILHEPPGAHGGVTFQIGLAAILREHIGATVVSDFRSADVAAGGHGAPLVPIVDWMFLRHPQGHPRALLNLGGMANVTRVVEDLDSTLAFDTGPGNVLLDLAASQATGGQQSYDEGGRLAASGRVDESLLDAWLAEPYFLRCPPKSTGRETFGATDFERRRLEAEAAGLGALDLLATLTALTVHSVARSVQKWIDPVSDLVVSGGGAHNRTLLDGLGDALEGTVVRILDEVAWTVEAKEAIAFAVLALLHLDGVPGNLPRVTGATRHCVLGQRTD